eukprot:2783001-Ditylum_brightwellii.AAC.2
MPRNPTQSGASLISLNNFLWQHTKLVQQLSRPNSIAISSSIKSSLRGMSAYARRVFANSNNYDDKQTQPSSSEPIP